MTSIFQRSGSLLLLTAVMLISGCRTGRGPEPLPPDQRPPEFPAFPGEPLRLPERRRPLEDFERISTLEVTSTSGRAFLSKNSAQALWGSSAAEIRYMPEKKRNHMVALTPGTPWIMPSLFDTVSLWIRDPGEGKAEGEHRIILHLRDERGRLHHLAFPYTPSSEWQMLHLRIPEAWPLPVHIERILWELPDETESPRRILLENLTLYQEVLSRVPSRVSYIRPFGYAPAFAPLRENSVTLNFPSAPFAFRPESSEDRFMVDLKALNRNEFQFTCTTPSTSVSYKIRAERGGPQIDLLHSNGKWLQAWSGPRVEGVEKDPEIRFSRIHDKKLILQYTDGVSFSLLMENKTLVISVESMREDLAGLDLGQLQLGERIDVPFLQTGAGEPLPVTFAQAGSSVFFLGAFPDWWFSMASHFEPGDSGRRIGQLRYAPRWRGSRNLFRERIYFTASPRLEEILPTVSTPPAMYKKEAGGLLWPPDNLAEHPLFSLRPVEEVWQNNAIARQPDGEWLLYPGQSGAVVKTAIADEIVIPRLLRTLTPNARPTLLLPEVTAHGPWRFTDFDNRVIGAGTFAQTYAEIGALLQQAEAEWGGPLFGAGGAELLWAGLVSGFVPEFSSQAVWQDLWIPHLAWGALTRVSTLLGMGDIENFRAEGETVEQLSRWVDRSLAVQVAYGAPGRLPSSGLSEEKRVHATRLLKALQSAIAGKSAERIAYWTGQDFVGLADAIAGGTVDRNQLYIRLEDQTEIWVNGSRKTSWVRRIKGMEWEMPPFGFVVRSPERFIAHLPQPNGEPGLSFIESPGSCWFSNPEELQEKDGMLFLGCIRLEKQDKGDYRLDIRQWSGVARFSFDRLPLDQIASIRAVDVDGTLVRDVKLVKEDGYWVLQSTANLKTVWISDHFQGGDLNLSP